MKKWTILILALVLGGMLAGPAFANPARDAIISGFAVQAKAADPSFSGFSAKRGKTLFFSKYGLGKPDTPSCTTCHTDNPRVTGKTRAGKLIDPVAVSVTPSRFTKPDKIAKWFRRNCKSVLGRECTPLEKGDYITFMASQ